MDINGTKIDIDYDIDGVPTKIGDLNLSFISKTTRLKERSLLGMTTTILTGAGALEIETPRVRDRRENESFIRKILPPYIPQGDFPSERAKIAQRGGGHSGTLSSRPIDWGFFIRSCRNIWNGFYEI